MDNDYILVYNILMVVWSMGVDQVALDVRLRVEPLGGHVEVATTVQEKD